MKCNLIVGHECTMDKEEEERACLVNEVQMIFYMSFNRVTKLYGREITAEALQWLIDKIKKEKE